MRNEWVLYRKSVVHFSLFSLLAPLLIIVCPPLKNSTIACSSSYFDHLLWSSDTEVTVVFFIRKKKHHSAALLFHSEKKKSGWHTTMFFQFCSRFYLAWGGGVMIFGKKLNVSYVRFRCRNYCVLSLFFQSWNLIPTANTLMTNLK